MDLKHKLRSGFSRRFLGEPSLSLSNRVPNLEELGKKLGGDKPIGLYLHVPFCRQLCPYCPYNKELFREDLAYEYSKALMIEVSSYAALIGKKPITSFYIGGGTPTTLLDHGLPEVLEHIYKSLNMQCSIHMECHPNDLSGQNLDKLQSMQVSYVSLGVEAFQDHHLKALHRPYTVEQVKRTIARVVGRSFDCVNIDYIFALPNQTNSEIAEACKAIVSLGVSQVATYPLVGFKYTPFGQMGIGLDSKLPTLVKRRKMLKIIEEYLYPDNFYRSSVWAFTKKGVDKYCSVSVPVYIGLGASGGSYLQDIFMVNTFSVKEYIHSMKEKRQAIALSLDLTIPMQMAGWLYWRIYETHFLKADFRFRFGVDIGPVYGKYLKFLSLLGLLNQDSHEVRLTDKGNFWLHAFEDLFSIDFISSLWGTAEMEPWPREIVLVGE